MHTSIMGAGDPIVTKDIMDGDCMPSSVGYFGFLFFSPLLSFDSLLISALNGIYVRGGFFSGLKAHGQAYKADFLLRERCFKGVPYAGNYCMGFMRPSHFRCMITKKFVEYSVDARDEHIYIQTRILISTDHKSASFLTSSL